MAKSDEDIMLNRDNPSDDDIVLARQDMVERLEAALSEAYPKYKWTVEESQYQLPFRDADNVVVSIKVEININYKMVIVPITWVLTMINSGVLQNIMQKVGEAITSMMVRGEG